MEVHLLFSKERKSKLDKADKINIILFCSASLLLFFYVLSFFKTSDRTKKDSLKSELINEKYGSKICAFEFSKGSGQEDQSLRLVKENDLWFIKNKKNYLPADRKIVETFINELIKVRNMYKISDKKSSDFLFSESERDVFHLRYFYSQNKEDFFDIYFGDHDFSGSLRYITSGKFNAIYEIDTALDIYLTSSVQFWSEKYIISREILGKINSKDIQTFYVKNDLDSPFIKKDFPEKLLELRHGGIADKSLTEMNDRDVELEFYFELGNKTSPSFKIFKSDNEGVYYIFADYKTFKTGYKISSWTYKSISDMIL